MLALRILSLPLAMSAFITLYIIAIKAPGAVEVTNIVIWAVLLIIGFGLLTQKLFTVVFNRRKEN